MVVRITALICCWASLGMAASNWSVSQTQMPDTPSADVGDTISTIIFSKAGRSATRISAGLSGDWATVIDSPRTAATASTTHPRPVFAPLGASTSDATGEDPVFASPAIALPLPSAAVAMLPGLLVAYLANRRFTRA